MRKEFLLYLLRRSNVMRHLITLYSDTYVLQSLLLVVRKEAVGGFVRRTRDMNWAFRRALRTSRALGGGFSGAVRVHWLV